MVEQFLFIYSFYFIFPRRRGRIYLPPSVPRQTIFSGLEQRFEKELEAVRLQYPSEAVAFTEEPLVVHWEDGIKMLRDAGHKVCAVRLAFFSRGVYKEKSERI